MLWICKSCGNKAIGKSKPTSCSGTGNALGCDGGNWEKQKKKNYELDRYNHNKVRLK